VFAELSVLDNLRLGAFPSGRITRAEMMQRIEAMFVRFPRLRERQHQRAACSPAANSRCWPWRAA
jgi:ABC-type branched-subunit amino acid transport system ATPase component